MELSGRLKSTFIYLKWNLTFHFSMMKMGRVLL